MCQAKIVLIMQKRQVEKTLEFSGCFLKLHSNRVVDLRS